MTDNEETMQQTEHDTGDLSRSISVAGLQVSQAAEELQQAAERLMNAEEQVHEAELRWHASDQQVAQAATKNAELLDMLQSAREGQSEADERCRRADQRLEVTLERVRILEDQITDLETKVEEVEGNPNNVTVIVNDERTALQEAIAAEVRRPLTSILGLTLALRHADPKSAEGKDMVKQLSTNARKLDRLVGEMLVLDEIANGSYQPNRRRTDLEALVRRVVEESPDLANRDVKIEAEHIAIEVDPALTEQMIETLLSNAGRRTAPGNPVRVKISSDQGSAVIAVDDTGPEVPPDLRGDLSSALSDDRPGSGKKKTGATGLSLLARLAEIHGGRAWVEESAGGGASFRVSLFGPKPDDDAGEGHAAGEREMALAEAYASGTDNGLVSNGHGELAGSGELSDEIRA
ncbi:MAG: HAMP domain-containing sensor histidine kinase [Actinomycetota bacterium]